MHSSRRSHLRSLTTNRKQRSTEESEWWRGKCVELNTLAVVGRRCAGDCSGVGRKIGSEISTSVKGETAVVYFHTYKVGGVHKLTYIHHIQQLQLDTPLHLVHRCVQIIQKTMQLTEPTQLIVTPWTKHDHPRHSLQSRQLPWCTRNAHCCGIPFCGCERKAYGEEYCGEVTDVRCEVKCWEIAGEQNCWAEATFVRRLRDLPMCRMEVISLLSHCRYILGYETLLLCYSMSPLVLKHLSSRG